MVTPLIEDARASSSNQQAVWGPRSHDVPSFAKDAKDGAPGFENGTSASVGGISLENLDGSRLGALMKGIKVLAVGPGLGTEGDAS
jgi:hypothetical protein